MLAASRRSQALKSGKALKRWLTKCAENCEESAKDQRFLGLAESAAKEGKSFRYAITAVDNMLYVIREAR